MCLARTCLRWEECVVWEEGGWGPRGKRCGAFQKDRFLWEIFPEIKVLSAEIRVRKYTYNRREILVWAKLSLSLGVALLSRDCRESVAKVSRPVAGSSQCVAMLSRDVADVSLGCREVSPGVASCLEVSHGCHIVSFGRHVYT